MRGIHSEPLVERSEPIELRSTSRPAVELTFEDFFKILWRGKLVMLSLAAGLGMVAALASLIPTRKYDASVIVSVVSQDTNSSRIGGLGSLLSQYGDLASLAGISLSGGGQKAETLAVLQSEALTERYIRDNNLLPVLFANLWNPVTHSWRTSDPDRVPTLWKANRFFKNNVRSVTEDTKTGLVTLTIKWKDPHVAAKWANDLIRLTNTYLRNKAIEEAQRNIDYLNSQVAKTTMVELQRAIYSLMESEIRKAMIARGSNEYALKVLDPAIAPEKPSSPKRLVWALSGVCAGILIAVVTILARAPKYL